MPDPSRYRDSDRTESAEGVVSPVVGRHEYLGKLEFDKWTRPHAVEILATTVLSVTRDLSELSESHDLNSGCSVVDYSTAPPSGRLSPPTPGLQQFVLCFQSLNH